MRYYGDPSAELGGSGGGGGGGGMEGTPRRRRSTTLARDGQPARGGAQGAVQDAAALARPQTFAEMQRAGMARPPAPPATLAPRVNPAVAPSTGVQRTGPGTILTHTADNIPGYPGTMSAAPGGSIITTRANPDGTSPWNPGPAGAPRPGTGLQEAPSAPPAGTPNFDPMEWLRTQILGGPESALGRSQDYLGGRIDDEYTLREQDLRDEMATRGLADSTVYGGRMQDLNVGRRTAKADLGERLALQDQDRRMSVLSQMLGLGQQGFENDLSTARFNRDQSNDYNNYILQLLGFGYGG